MEVEIRSDLGKRKTRVFRGHNNHALCAGHLNTQGIHGIHYLMEICLEI